MSLLSPSNTFFPPSPGSLLTILDTAPAAPVEQQTLGCSQDPQDGGAKAAFCMGNGSLLTHFYQYMDIHGLYNAVFIRLVKYL